MKKLICSIGLAVVTAGSISHGAGLVVPPGVPNTFSNLAILPATINAGAVSNLTSQPIFITPGYGVGVEVAWTNALTTATSNFQFTVNITMDGSNWMTRAPYTCTVSTASAVTNRFFTNFPAFLFDSAMKARVESLSNAGDISNSVSPKRVLIGRAKQSLVHPHPQP